MPGDEPRPVSGFGHLRVKAWLAAHRSLSQPSHVLHRLSTPRHPPGTLSNLTTFLARTLAREHFQDSVIFVVTTFLKLSKIASSRSRADRCQGHLDRRLRITGGSGTGPTHSHRPGQRNPPGDVSSVRVPSLAAHAARAGGGGDRSRTCDHLLAKQELYH